MIRIALTQPDIRPYRVPAYDLLASQPDIELHVFADQPGDAPPFDESAVKFHYHRAPVERKKVGPITFFRQAAQMEVVDPDRFDLVIHTWNLRYRTLAPALSKAQRLNVPTVLRGHGYSKSDTWLRTRMRNRLGKRAAGVMLYTHPIAERLVEQYGFDRNRVFVSQNALDQAPIQAARSEWLARPDDLQAFRQQHALQPDRTIVFISRLYRENRPDLLVRAVADLQSKLPGCTAVIVGDGPERQPLELLAAELGVAEHVRFAGALYNEDELAPWLLSSGAFCYPENVGLSLLTAFGFGLPVVTSDNIEGQNPEVVALVPEKNGLLYPHGNPKAMAEALARILSDRELQQRMSAEAIRTVTEDFSLSTMVQGYIDATRLVDGQQRTLVKT